jgi:hypothetical protein
MTPALPEPPSFEIMCKVHVLQDIVEKELVQDIWVTCVCCQCMQELVKVRPSTRPAVTAVLLHKECEHVAGVITCYPEQPANFMLH